MTPREVYKSVLIGTILGDGGLRFKGKNCRLHIKHAVKQLPLVRYKRKMFEEFVSMNIYVFEQTIKGRKYKFAEFVTKTHPLFTDFYHIFYRDEVKIVPDNIEEILTDPLSLAVWFMDDGSAEYAGFSFQTHCFTRREVDLLRKTLFNNFGLDTTKRMNKKRWILYVKKRSVEKFRDLVQKFVLKDFQYKLIPYSTK